MTAPHYADDAVTLYHGSCLDILRELPDASVDAVVTDPPYGLANTSPAQVTQALTEWVTGDREFLPGGAGFMGKAWDAFVPPVAVWDECYRVLKPGGHVLAFAGARTGDLMGLALRLAGFEIRDSIAWLYGSGFPKSLDVSKAIDKAAGAERETVGRAVGAGSYSTSSLGPFAPEYDATIPATPAAEKWQGWGTALKPAFEPIVVGRKPLAGTVAATVLAHGTGALNIDACRVGDEVITAHGGGVNQSGRIYGVGQGIPALVAGSNPHTGRWPTNVVLDGTQAAELDKQSGVLTSGKMLAGTQRAPRDGVVYGRLEGDESRRDTPGDSGGASRFFPTFRYEAKAPTHERPRVQRADGTWEAHSTVKPLDLMRWLVRLVTPPGGTVLEPFAGSGTTAEACVVEGFKCIAIEREADYLPLIVSRLTKPLEVTLDFGDFS